jgi:dihydroorotase
LKKSAIGLPAVLHPAGTMSEGRKGEQLSEMFDMHLSGARAFTDYKRSINRAELMHRALDYARNFNGLVMSFPWDDTLCPGGQMHEGPMSVSLGMKGIPEITEETRLSRDLEILRYTGGRLHVSLISTRGSVELIRKAKSEGLNVTCGVAAHQLLFTDELLRDFDTRYKVMPPLRNREHIDALIEGVKDGTIDIICSDHSPKEIELKKVEFDHAAFGMSTIETAVPTALSVLKNPELIARVMGLNPRKILGVDDLDFMPGAAADFTLIEEETWTPLPKNFLSKSKNYPTSGPKFSHRVHSIIRS